jgi:hypothetical protein
VSARLPVLIVLALLASACSASYPTAPGGASTVGLMIDVRALGSVTPAQVLVFEAFSLDSDGAYHNVSTIATWSSSDPSVVRASAGGLVTSVAPGGAQIMARYEGASGSAWMVVTDPRQPESYPRLTVQPVRLTAVGGTALPSAILQLSPDASRQLVTTRVTWSSSEPAVATIDANGRMRAVGIGTTLITATLDGLTDWFWVTVPPSQ